MALSPTDWIGRSEESEELLSPAPALAAAAMLDEEAGDWRRDRPLPPLWHWFYFTARARHSELGPDGHPRRGGFMPPISLPRRMIAGGRLSFPVPLRIGRPARQESVIRSVSEKEGRTGRLAFVTVERRVFQDGTLCVEEEQDVVYRQPGPPLAAPAVRAPAPAPADAWTRVVTPDPVLLFRFSALTFNGHRIHYDRPYAVEVEGYPGLVVHGALVAVLMLDLVRAQTGRTVRSFSFRGQSPLFDLAPFRLVGVQDGDQVRLEALGPDGAVAIAAEARLGTEPG